MYFSVKQRKRKIKVLPFAREMQVPQPAMSQMPLTNEVQDKVYDHQILCCREFLLAFIGKELIA